MKHKMDLASEEFRSLSANLTSIAYTAIVNDKSQEKGTIIVHKAKPKGTEILISFTQPDPKVVSFENQQAKIYTAKLNTVQVFDLGKQGKLLDAYLLLGFGTSGKALAQNYDVTALGVETVAGQKATHLQLVPKSDQMKAQFPKIELWIAESGAYPVQQKLCQPSGDYRQYTYTEVKLNPALAPDAARLRLPKGVKTEYPGR